MITVVDYDPQWPRTFERLREEYAAAMDAAGVPVVAIEHVGSTSVPGLAAKPIVDCDIVVAAEDVTAAGEVLVGLGFVPLGELGIPWRWAFRAPERLAGTNTYVTVEGSLALRNHRTLRDVLRTDASLREEYARAKRSVAAGAATIDEYVQGKSAVIQKILAAGGLARAELAEIDSHQPLPAAAGPADADIARHLPAADAVRWMGEAVDAHHRGDLVAPPRVRTDLGDGSLTFTTGRLRGSWFGYRSYDSFPSEPGAQVVVVHDEGDGGVRAIAVGNELGPRRVGAIGGVAADALASADADTVAVIGTGVQAAMQVWGLSAVRTVRELRVWSRSADHRRAFVTRVSPMVPGTVRPAGNPRSAVDGADIVILATSSSTPVVEGSWLGPATYVTAVGPKQRGRAEFGPDLAAVAELLVTDSPAQVEAYDPPHVLAGTAYQDRLVSLGEVRAGEVALPPEPRVAVFFSVGLAGTEAFMLDRLASSLGR